MTPRPDLSNDAFAIATGDQALGIAARPTSQIGTIFIGLIVMGISILPVFGSRTVDRWQKRGELPKIGEVWEVSLWTLPAFAAGTVFTMVILRRRRLRALQIADGIVTLWTPDQPIGMYRFERRELKGAQLNSTAGFTELCIQRRRGMDVTVFRGTNGPELGELVDLINKMVIDDQAYGFQVMLVAKDPRD